MLLGFYRAVCVSFKTGQLAICHCLQRQLSSDAPLGCLRRIIEDVGDLSSVKMLSGPPQFVNHMKEALQENESGDFTERVTTTTTTTNNSFNLYSAFQGPKVAYRVRYTDSKQR